MLKRGVTRGITAGAYRKQMLLREEHVICIGALLEFMIWQLFFLPLSFFLLKGINKDPVCWRRFFEVVRSFDAECLIIITPTL